MSRIAACLTGLLLATTPATAFAHHHEDAERPPGHGLRFAVETDRLVYRPHEPMAITVSVHNPNPEPVRLTFPTTHQAAYSPLPAADGPVLQQEMAKAQGWGSGGPSGPRPGRQAPGLFCGPTYCSTHGSAFTRLPQRAQPPRCNARRRWCWAGFNW